MRGKLDYSAYPIPQVLLKCAVYERYCSRQVSMLGAFGRLRGRPDGVGVGADVSDHPCSVGSDAITAIL
jgi:hypothetical protein